MTNEKVSPYKKGDIDMHQMRRAKPAEFWETHIEKWKATTNEPKSEYCKRHGLLETQFTYWIKLEFKNGGSPYVSLSSIALLVSPFYAQNTLQ